MKVFRIKLFESGSLLSQSQKSVRLTCIKTGSSCMLGIISEWYVVCWIELM